MKWKRLFGCIVICKDLWVEVSILNGIFDKLSFILHEHIFLDKIIVFYSKLSDTKVHSFGSGNICSSKMLRRLPLRVKPFHGWRQSGRIIIIHPITSFWRLVWTHIHAIRRVPRVSIAPRLILIRRLHIAITTKYLIIVPLASEWIYLLWAAIGIGITK